METFITAVCTLAILLAPVMRFHLIRLVTDRTLVPMSRFIICPLRFICVFMRTRIFVAANDTDIVLIGVFSGCFFPAEQTGIPVLRFVVLPVFIIISMAGFRIAKKYPTGNTSSHRYSVVAACAFTDCTNTILPLMPAYKTSYIAITTFTPMLVVICKPGISKFMIFIHESTSAALIATPAPIMRFQFAHLFTAVIANQPVTVFVLLICFKSVKRHLVIVLTCQDFPAIPAFAVLSAIVSALESANFTNALIPVVGFVLPLILTSLTLKPMFISVVPLDITVLFIVHVHSAYSTDSL